MDSIPSWSYELYLTAEPASAARAREFVCVHLLEHGLRHLVDDVCLVASELVTNAILHAQSPFTVALRSDDRSVTLTVRDLSPIVPLMAAGGVMDVGGRGLLIVDLLSRDWGVVRRPGGSKSVWARFATEDQTAMSR